MKVSSVKDVFNKVVGAVFGIILILIIGAILIGVVQLFLGIGSLLTLNGITGHYIDIIVDILTLYVLIELARSLVEYFESHRLRLTFIVDAAIVFIIRELLIGLFKHEIKADMLYGFSAILLVLGALRIASIIVYQREKMIVEEKE